MGDYLSTSEALLASLPGDITLDLEDLNMSLEGIRNRDLSGEGTYPQVFRVNERMVILAEPRWLQDWH